MLVIVVGLDGRLLLPAERQLSSSGRSSVGVRPTTRMGGAGGAMGGRGQRGPGANHRAGAPPTCNTDLSAAQNGIVQEEWIEECAARVREKPWRVQIVGRGGLPLQGC